MAIFRKKQAPTPDELLDSLPMQMDDGYVLWHKDDPRPHFYALGHLGVVAGCLTMLEVCWNDHTPPVEGAAVQIELALPPNTQINEFGGFAIPDDDIYDDPDDWIIAKMRVALSKDGTNLHYLWPTSDLEVPEGIRAVFGHRHESGGLALTCLTQVVRHVGCSMGRSARRSARKSIRNQAP